GRANCPCDVAVGARLTIRNRLQVAPDLPLKGGRFDVERQIELRRPAVQMRDQRAYPLRERSSFTLDGCRRILGTQILLELLVSIAKLDGTQSLVSARDKQPPERRVNDRERNRGARGAAAILRWRDAASGRTLFVYPAARSIAGIVNRG